MKILGDGKAIILRDITNIVYNINENLFNNKIEVVKLGTEIKKFLIFFMNFV